MHKFVIDTKAGTVLPAPMENKESCPIYEAWHRLGEEIEGWKEYRNLTSQNEKYGTAAKQEFMHALMAFDDLLKELFNSADAEEREEMLKFKNVMFSE